MEFNRTKHVTNVWALLRISWQSKRTNRDDLPRLTRSDDNETVINKNWGSRRNNENNPETKNFIVTKNGSQCNEKCEKIGVVIELRIWAKEESKQKKTKIFPLRYSHVHKHSSLCFGFTIDVFLRWIISWKHFFLF